MADWRFYGVVRAGPKAGAVRDEIPLTDATIVERLKGVGSISGRLGLRDPKATPQNLNTENTVIVAERDGVPLAAGPFLTVDKSLGSTKPEISISSEGPWRILRDRVIRSIAGMTNATLKAGEVRFSQVDQFNIVKDLVDHTNSFQDTNIDVVWDALSGVLRDRSYEADKTRSVGETIEQLSDVENGFDWHIELGGDVFSGVTYSLKLSYPFRGRDTGFRFDLDASQKKSVLALQDSTGDILRDSDGNPLGYGQSVVPSGSGNVIDYGYTETSEDRVSRFTAVGPGEGASQLVAHAEDATLAGVLPLIERGGSWPDVTRQSTLNGHAKRNLQIDKRASKVPTLIVDPNALPTINSYTVGDIIGSKITDGWVQVDGQFRIIGRQISIGEDGEETVQLELNELGRF